MPARSEYSIDHSQETKEDKPIKSSTQLAKELGLERDKTKKPSARLHTYTAPVLAPFSITVNGETRNFSGSRYLVIDDFGGPKRQLKRISTGVLIADSTGKTYKLRGGNIAKIEKIATQFDFSVERGAFTKTELKKGGYNKIREVLQKLNDDDFYGQNAESLKQRMEKEIAEYFKRVNEVLMPALDRVFPGYSLTEIDYFRMGNAYFSPEKPNKKLPVLQIDMMENRIYVAYYKKSKDFYCVHPPFERMPGGEPLASWLYEDRGMNSVTIEALEALKANINNYLR